MAKKKTGFFENVARVVTGRTAEQRKADAEARARAKSLEVEAYRQEQLKQAPSIGQARAKYQAKERIRAITHPKAKPSPASLLVGPIGGTAPAKTIDPFTFGTTQAKKTTAHVPTVNEVANMKFVDYANQSTAKNKVKSKIKRKRRRKK